MSISGIREEERSGPKEMDEVLVNSLIDKLCHCCVEGTCLVL